MSKKAIALKAVFRLVLIGVAFCSFISVKAQQYIMSNDAVTTCNGLFYDSGVLANYGNNESFVFTICPGIPGDIIQAAFNTFDLSGIDELFVYDGNSIAAPLLGGYTGTALAGSVVEASIANTSGCLTFQFISDGFGTAPGWEAQITCSSPCVRPVAIASSNPSAFARVCVGDVIDFDGSASTVAPGFNIVDYEWNFADGNTANGAQVSHSYADPGEYIVQLYLMDNIGCSSTNSVDLVFWVGTEPTFDGTTADQSICLGETVCLDGVVTGTEWNGIPPNLIAGTTALPDGSGVSYTTSIPVSGFTPGSTIGSALDIVEICMNIEHSYLGDLEVVLECPNGMQVVLFDGYNGPSGGTYLGDPIDNNTGTPGMGWTYCFSEIGVFGTLIDEDQLGNHTMSTLTPGNSMTPGNYTVEGTFADFIGCDLNGNWTLTITDNLGIDDGFIFNWSITFDPALYPSITSFTPVYGAQCDSTSWSGPDITSTSADCNNICVQPSAVGNFDYLFTATDNFGCTYDTTITVTVTQGAIVDAGPDQVICNDSLQLNASITNLPPPPTPPYEYSWTPIAGLSNPNISNPLVHTTVTTMYYVTAWEQGHPDCTHTDSLTITIDPGLNPGEDTLAIVCASDPIFNLYDMLGGTPDPGGVWTDTLGNPTASTFDPSTQPDDFFMYTVTTILGCVGSAILEIQVLPLGHPDCCGIPEAGANDLSCDLSYTLNAIPGNPNVGVWTGPAGASFSDPTDSNAVVTMNTGGTFMFYWTEDDNITCNVQDSVSITFTSPIYANLSTTDAICFDYCDGTVQAAPVGGNTTGAYTYTWSNGLAGVNDDNASGICDGNYTVTVFDDNNCSSDTSFVITEPPPMTIDAINIVDETCFSECDGQVEVLASSAVQYSFDGGTTFSPVDSVVDQCVGIMNIVVQDIDGCMASGIATISGPPEVEAEFTSTPQPANILAPTVTFNNVSTGASSYFWDFGGLGNSIAYQPIFVFPGDQPGTYEVCLTATNDNGCTHQFCDDVEVEDELLIYVPNSFTPNGDGTNDWFGPSFNITVGKYEMLIFDRWGQVVYETDNPYEPWFGSFKNNNSEVLQEGVYAWKLRVQDSQTGLKKELFGHVTLLK